MKNQKIYCLRYVIDYLRCLLVGGLSFTDAEREGITSFVDLLEEMIKSEELLF